jgi:hypothetical protein
MADEDESLGWNDPAVIIGAVALAIVIVMVLYGLFTGNFHRSGGGTSSTSTSRYLIPSGSARPTSTAALPYPNCAAAARDGRRNIHIGDPAYNPALDRNHDGIACSRGDG